MNQTTFQNKIELSIYIKLFLQLQGQHYHNLHSIVMKARNS